MKNTKITSPSSARTDQKLTPSAPRHSYDEIAACARSIWLEKGRPDGRDEEIWFEAERRLKNGSASVADRRAFADPAELMNPDNEPAGRLEERLREAAAPAESRSATSL
jgi:hypothetical protein